MNIVEIILFLVILWCWILILDLRHRVKSLEADTIDLDRKQLEQLRENIDVNLIIRNLQDSVKQLYRLAIREANNANSNEKT